MAGGVTTGRVRDFIRFGKYPPKSYAEILWPRGRGAAINYEQGTDQNPSLGDSSLTSGQAFGVRERDHMPEAEYEYNTQVGICRLVSLVKEYNVPFSVYLSSEALAVNPALEERVKTGNCDIISNSTSSTCLDSLVDKMQRVDLGCCIDKMLQLFVCAYLGPS